MEALLSFRFERRIRVMRKRFSFGRSIFALAGIPIFMISVMVLCLTTEGIAGCRIDQGSPAFEKAAQHIQKAVDVQKRHAEKLMRIRGVVATAVTLDDDGMPAVLVCTKGEEDLPGVPGLVEDVPVVKRVTGEIRALKPPSGVTKVRVDPTAYFVRPVPIGISTGNAGECSAGTIGARVTDGTYVYALSNNHVYALENDASPNEEVLQPGLYDTGCLYEGVNHMGTLYAYSPIVFGGSTPNVIDAAIALTDTGSLGNGTPSNGYGIPSSGITDAALDMPVQKYGRTTALTKGTVMGINASVQIGYESGTALFNDQILVYSKKPFIKAGDSGSLLVTDAGREPVGLLFAGDATGKYAFANPIGGVLEYFGVVVDGQ
jgi:hypothetical protein